MNRSLFFLIPVLQLLMIHSLTAAQSQPVSFQLPSSPCKNISQDTTLKGRSVGNLARNPQPITSERKTAAANQMETLEVAKPLRVEIFGLSAMEKSDAVKRLCRDHAFPENKPLNTVAIDMALREMLIGQGYAYAQVGSFDDHQGVLNVFVNQGPRVPLSEIRFEGNRIFPRRDLVGTINGCLKRIGEAKVTDYDSDVLEYCGRLVINRIRSSGYLQANMTSKTEVSKSGYVVSFVIDEGRLYRLGKIVINGHEALTAEQIRSRLPLREGDVASGDKLAEWLFEDLKKAYGEMGFVQYTAELVPTFKSEQGIVDFEVEIEEGRRFTLRSLTFIGDLIQDVDIEDLLLIRVGDFYNHRLLLESIARLNALNLFAAVDPDKDVNHSSDDKNALLSLVIKLKKRQ